PSSSQNYFDKSFNFCASSQQQLDTLGLYADEFQGWRGSGNAWVDLSNKNTARDRPVECRSDRGIHGSGASGTEVWAAEGPGGPWSADNSNEPFWSTTYSLYDGNWLNWQFTPPSQTTTRLEAVQQVALLLADNFKSINIGLQRYGRDEGGGIIDAVEDIAVNRQDFKGNVISLTADGATPLSEVYYEAGQYFMGRDVDYGNIQPHVSVPQTRVGLNSSSNTYLSPADSSCQNNYIVFLTDGEPFMDGSADGKVASWPGWADKIGACDGSGEGHCLDDMADYLYQADVSDAPGAQNVTTYTIGFLTDFPLLKSTAERGGGEYRTANDAASLALVLTEIFLDILDDATSFTAPAVPVNAFNRTRNLADAYVSVFAPARRMHWPGNLKKYRLVQGEMHGQDGLPAVDDDTGFFSADSFSYWSASPDGDRVIEGGSANEIPSYQTRNLYTNIAGNQLSAAGNAVTVGNGSVTAAMLSAPDPERDAVINWARGLDEFDEDDDLDVLDDRHVMGDPLHVRPATVIYGGTADAPDATIFTSTNDGYFHAIDADDGSELWAFIPSRLLGKMYGLYLNNLGNGIKNYGLDGNIKVYIKNDDGDPGISGAEQVILLFGMRRGGSATFALDVTDRNNPTLLWELDDNDLPDMGQSWSTPQVAKVNVGGTNRFVAIFGGGYDDGQDSATYRTDTKGNAIYMIDLDTGQRIWSAGHSATSVGPHDLLLDDMEHSIPAPIKVVDMSLNGKADRMYVGDMGGRVWRFDINNGSGANELVDGGVLASVGAADLGNSPPASEIRRFYATPDIVPVVTEHSSYLAVNIGSGYRAHPLWTAIDDEFYSIRDFNVFDAIPTADYDPPVTRADLLDITYDPDPVLFPTDAGWRMGMVTNPGEKVLAESFTFNNQVFFTSFSPNTGQSTCIAGPGLNRLYRVNVRDGSPVENLDESEDDTELTEEDRSTELDQGGIAPEPIFIFPEDEKGEPVVCVGVECLDPGFDGNAIRTYWFQDETQ
ncbi:MAG: PQQ-binding-like beta-propeller repeat protein, partial [Gammaproteobacteria bacterium]|nr:PQQ-binding-like beta-propeller repeat protein [Gammaproteobacteria bacterium]